MSVEAMFVQSRFIRVYFGSVPCTKDLLDGGFSDEKYFFPLRERIDLVREDIVHGVLTKEVSLENAPHCRIVDSVISGENLIAKVCARLPDVTSGFLPVRIEDGRVYFSRVLEFSCSFSAIAQTILLQEGLSVYKKTPEGLEYALLFECSSPLNRSVEHFAKSFLLATNPQ
ncbi:MAG: hypothetical protein Q7K43_03235 [Candidatus Woesearchaeota archaeon]|nr:hypothetical protein [Candidatus Woesearchaeota archaeon]